MQYCDSPGGLSINFTQQPVEGASGSENAGSLRRKANLTMPTLPEAHGIIPARYASTRFPGKPLYMMRGKPMFWHVWHRASLCPSLSSVSLATDDDKILAAARELGVPALPTSSTHQSGTDRVFEAARLLQLPRNSVVVNIQGDEPALDPAVLTELLQAFHDPEVRVATLARRIPVEEMSRPDQVKLTLGTNGNALYFSRAPIPYSRNGRWDHPPLGHIGLYAFTMSTLERFVSLPPSSLELTESLEQLRLLENNIPIRVVLTEKEFHGVDRVEDVAKVLPLL